MKSWQWLPVLLMSSVASSAWADQIEGVVRAAGRPLEPQTMITPESDDLGPELCDSVLVQRIRRLTPLVVKVIGHWQTKKNGDKKCFIPTEFKVLRMASGREPLVGLLALKDGVYTVALDDHKIIEISDVPSGLKKLVGQKVIVDVKTPEVAAALPLQAKSVKDRGPQNIKTVITYQPFP